MSYLSDHYVEETRFGLWFLRSQVWQRYVLRAAINDLRGLFSEALPVAPVLLDAGCGQGKSFPLHMIRQQGFEFTAHKLSYPYLWWSRAKDFGLLERLGLCKPKPFGQRQETLVNVARKPFEGTL
ncbi:hypothetical protein [Pseudomonas sp. NFX15]|uniref:hypothetical protein n=1 Tax=Pseudomonas sp. NFX15 TaxID=2816958 RepID=UPI003B8CA359